MDVTPTIILVFTNLTSIEGQSYSGVIDNYGGLDTCPVKELSTRFNENKNLPRARRVGHYGEELNYATYFSGRIHTGFPDGKTSTCASTTSGTNSKKTRETGNIRGEVRQHFGRAGVRGVPASARGL